MKKHPDSQSSGLKRICAVMIWPSVTGGVAVLLWDRWEWLGLAAFEVFLFFLALIVEVVFGRNYKG